MNGLFSIVFLLATLLLLFLAPESFLPTLLQGATKSATLCFSLISTYAVWLGLMNVWKDSGVTRVVSRSMQPLAKKLFKTSDPETLDAVCMNMSVNLLGISGAATPYGIKAANLLDKADSAEYSSSMLFVINATSIQLIPTSIIGVRTALHSVAPADIILPTLITTVFSTLLAVGLVRLLIPPKPREIQPITATKKVLTRGAGI